jgi:multiple antibiotic resistance protein
MTELLISAFVTFFVVIDPPGCAPIFASLTDGTSPAHQRRMAYRSTMVATGVLLFFALLGEPLLSALGISLDAFRIAGGIMLFLIAIDMVFEKRTERRENRAQAVAQGADGGLEAEDISVFPMGIPMIAGPGTIASVMLLTARSDGWTETFVVLGALALVLAMTLAALLAAGPLMRKLGRNLEAMITRILGVILAALAAQFVIDGIRRSFALG